MADEFSGYGHDGSLSGSVLPSLFNMRTVLAKQGPPRFLLATKKRTGTVIARNLQDSGETMRQAAHSSAFAAGKG
jgi:hypothetical protein